MKNPRYSTDKSGLKKMRFDFDEFFADVRRRVHENHGAAESALRKLQEENCCGTPALLSAPFAIDGSLELPIESFAVTEEFFSLPGRVAVRDSHISLRGARYLASIDPILEVRQKIAIFVRDFLDALICALAFERCSASNDFWRQSAVLDYAKNSAITLTNALVQSEKLGDFKVADEAYQLIRFKSVELASLATNAYYAHLLGRWADFRRNIELLKAASSSVEEIGAWLRSAYVVGVFSSRYFTRPEASHPLVIASSCCLVSEKCRPGPQTVVGLPSGATEIALAQIYFQELYTGEAPNLILLPYSMHSSKLQFNRKAKNHPGCLDYLRYYQHYLVGAHVLLVDDNSSTGRTVQRVADLLLRKEFDLKSLKVSVSEADIVRSQVDLATLKRKYIGTHEVYRMSVNVLPVSRRIKPKTDLREIKERGRLVFEYDSRSKETDDVVTRVVNQSYVRMVTSPTVELLDDLSAENAILVFRNTFLSNFFLADVEFGGLKYHSVEHAYQAQKFTTSSFDDVLPEVKAEISKILARRGLEYDFCSFEKFFTDRNLTAGSIKVVAEYLRRQGYARPDWDDCKAKIMANLLLQKFRVPALISELRATGSKYLVETNTWSDTLWGICDGKGRNLLGHLIMTIRDEVI